MKSNSFLFVSPVPQRFAESEKGLIVEANLITLDKTSTNNREYSFQDAEYIMKSMLGAPVYYGVTPLGTHLKGNETREVGKILGVRLIGKTIYGKLKIFAEDIIKRIKNGTRFLLSVGGIAESMRLINKAGRKVMQMIKPFVDHIQLFSSQEGEAGFAGAEITKILKYEESALFCGESAVAILVALGVI